MATINKTFLVSENTKYQPTNTTTDNYNVVGNALANTIITGSLDDTLDGGEGNDSLVGLGGNDLYIINSLTDVVVEALSGGTDSVRSKISNYTLAGNTEVLILDETVAVGTGNSLANTLIGNDANNTLNGGLGNDSLVGGAGNDYYIIDSLTDSVVEDSDSGTDSINTNISGYTLAANTEVLILSGAVAVGTGNASDNTLIGNSAANTLNGGAGIDSLFGGLGNDYYLIDNADDVVSEALAAGTDSVVASFSNYTLANDTEVLILAGSVAAGAGNSLANTLIGNAAANTLDGGLGNDSLVGLGGNDFYSIDSATDVVVEGLDSGTDSVSSTLNATLAANTEVLILGGTAALGTGNSLANTLMGNASNNTLDGGLGIDSLAGGAGNDSYILDNASDVVFEASSAGTDSVVASFSGYTLTNNTEVLILASTVAGGTGNSLANTLIGNSVANSLSALDGNDRLDGGAGADTLNGGRGSDFYVIDSLGDTIVEASGNDSVLSKITGYTLAANTEVLILDSTVASGTGNSLANTLFGNSAANTLDGGIGIDSLVGGAGNDLYILDNEDDTILEASAAGIDSVVASFSDYTLAANTDVLILSGTVAVGTGNTIANTLIGNSAANTLDGGAGNDSLVGGLDNDYYLVDSTTDVVLEAAASGTDSVVASVTGYTLAGNAEVLILSGTVAAGTGNSLANTLIGNSAANTFDGGAGNDYYIVSTGDSVVESSLAGTDSIVANVSGYTLDDNAEVLILGGSVAAGTGNSLANTLIGNAAANTLTGGDGNDYYILSTGDSVVETLAEGTDSVVTNVSGYTLNNNVEVLILSGLVAAGAGNSLANTIIGNKAVNTLDGGAGNDSLVGGDGSDYYIVDSLTDVILETSTLAGGGVDSVLANISGYTLAGNTDVLILDESIVAGTGNILANTLVGNDAGNSLNGGAGVDSLVGGAGNDTYFVDNAFDVVSESEDNGTDLVVSSISYSLKNNFENLILGGAALAGSGNSGDNRITGNASANRLNGLLGADTMIGGGGNDTFVVDNIDDSVLGGIGIDAVESRIASYTLGSTIENLKLVGSVAVTGTGNALSNNILGNALNNSIDGGANSSTLLGDVLIGGEGDDTITVNSTLDFVDGGEGTDLVLAKANIVLGDDVENLRLIGTAAMGQGNDLDNEITGNSLNNTLNGQEGSDLLVGGLGDDLYLIDAYDLGVIENEEEGLDTVRTSFDYALADNVENLQLTGGSATTAFGNSIDNQITGSIADNIIDAMEGDDTVVGGDGADSVIGGEGYDVLIGGNDSDTIVADEYDYSIDGGDGDDWIISAADVDLSDGRTTKLENIILSDVYALDPETGDTSLTEYQPTNATGDSLSNQIFGNMVANSLVGGGGDDTFSGGGGNDTISIDSVDSLVDGGDDSDWITSDRTVSLGEERFYSIENIALTGESNINVTGDDGDNSLVGNDYKNTLSGGDGDDYLDGGLGKDYLDGGLGTDTLVGGDGNDTVVMNSADAYFDGGDGVDYILSSTSISLQGMYNVEVVRLTGSGSFTVTGDETSNLLIGNSGANTLTGAGDFDTLTGGSGADMFVIGDASSNELTNQGNYYGNSFEETYVLITDFAVGSDRLQLNGASAGSYVVDDSDITEVLITSTDSNVGLVAKINVVSGNAEQILNNAVFVA